MNPLQGLWSVGEFLEQVREVASRATVRAREMALREFSTSLCG